MNKDYVKQLEAANEELQRKLEEQCKVTDIFQDNLSRLQDEFADYKKRNNLVVMVSKDDNMLGYRWTGADTEILHTASLAVVRVTQEEKQKVFDAYQISPDVKLSLFKSVKDRNNKQGSIYDIDMLRAYSRGESVKPYVI